MELKTKHQKKWCSYSTYSSVTSFNHQLSSQINETPMDSNKKNPANAPSVLWLSCKSNPRLRSYSPGCQNHSKWTNPMSSHHPESTTTFWRNVRYFFLSKNQKISFLSTKRLQIKIFFNFFLAKRPKKTTSAIQRPDHLFPPGNNMGCVCCWLVAAAELLLAANLENRLMNCFSAFLGLKSEVFKVQFVPFFGPKKGVCSSITMGNAKRLTWRRYPRLGSGAAPLRVRVTQTNNPRGAEKKSCLDNMWIIGKYSKSSLISKSYLLFL